jgi:hypothetical protein
MKCPYIIKTRIVQQSVYDYFDDGTVSAEQLVQDTEEGHTDCIKEECAMWEDGKCKRRS